jgi:hypothetical protein
MKISPRSPKKTLIFFMDQTEKYQIVKIDVLIQSDDNPLRISEILSYQNPFDTLKEAEHALKTIEYPGIFTIWKVYIQQ